MYARNLLNKDGNSSLKKLMERAPDDAPKVPEVTLLPGWALFAQETVALDRAPLVYNMHTYIYI